jgi:hypothetical protein
MLYWPLQLMPKGLFLLKNDIARQTQLDRAWRYIPRFDSLSGLPYHEHTDPNHRNAFRFVVRLSIVFFLASITLLLYDT